MSAFQSVEHVQGILRIEGVVYVPEVILLWTILILIITVVWEVLDELREKTKSRLVYINNLHSVKLGDINSKQVLSSNQLKGQLLQTYIFVPLEDILHEANGTLLSIRHIELALHDEDLQLYLSISYISSLDLIFSSTAQTGTLMMLIFSRFIN
jgi:hypothetical protein